MALMEGARFRAVSVVILATMVLAGVGSIPSSATAQGSDATLKSTMLMVIQGNTDAVPGTEGKNDFYALKILSFDLPHDVARVYTAVPSSAREISVWYGTNTFNQSQYGMDSSGPHSGQFHIDVPTSHPRTANYSVAAVNAADFTTTGSQLVNLNFSSGALRLINDSLTGTYLSPNITISSAVSISSVLLTLNGNSTGNVTSRISTDGGTSWLSVQNATQLNTTSAGTSLQIMFELTGNATLGYDTCISSFQLTTRYVAVATVFTVHVSYLWTAEFSGGGASIDLSEPSPFSTNGSYIIMIYTLIGYVPTGTGMQLVFDENRTMNTYDDKDLFLSTTYPSGVVSYSAVVTAPKSSSNLAVYSVAIILGVALAGAYLYRGSRAGRTRDARAPSQSRPVKEVEPALDTGRRKELVEQKKAMLAEIDNVRSRLSAGEITQAVASLELARIKKEFKVVRNELNKLSRRSSAQTASDSVSPAAHEPIIAALARIDEDFEKGRLPESTYKSLRKEYVQRAARLMADQSASAMPLSPIEQEKNKLMEAIVTLDEEHEKGEIDEKVYSDLRSSYRKQLAELMRKSGASDGVDD